MTDLDPTPPRQTMQRPAELLAGHTTMRVGGPATRFRRIDDPDELIRTVSDLDAAGEAVLILGGGSNLLVADRGFDGTVIKVATRGIDADVSDCAGAVVQVAAGEPWDDLVALSVRNGWSGLEALSGIPGSMGATPIQNVGAYGADVGRFVAGVRTLDRQRGVISTLFAADCGFGYRTSVFKAEPGRYLVLEVTLQLPLGSLSAPIRYAELARALGVDLGARVPAEQVRAAVLALRAGKGMVLDDADPDTWSAGSFFTNPVLNPEQADLLPEGAPRFPQSDGGVKTSAAWLIEHAGFGRGFGSGPARLSTKHTLALTNRGTARSEDLLALARTVRDGVRDTFGVVLVPEPVLVGCSL